MEIPVVPLQVVGYSIGVALVNEALNWAFVYRSAGFRSVNGTLTRLGSVAEEPAATAKRQRKREASLASAKADAQKQVGFYNTITGVITMVVMMAAFRLLPKFFGNEVAAQLPFEPPAFLRKLTQRGLTDAPTNACSATFIYVLCQASVRAFLTKFSPLGPGREWTEAGGLTMAALKQA